jgi:hypothetical protein
MLARPCGVELPAKGEQHRQEVGLLKPMRRPPGLQSCVWCYQALRVAGQEHEHIEFLWSQLQLVTTQVHGMTGKIDLEITGFNYTC